MNERGFQVRAADWTRDAALLREVRYAVFVVEQRVSEDLEWDGIDGACTHALAEDAEGRTIGCGRLLPDGHIGRMAVVAPWRRSGVGSAIFEHLLALARERGHAKAIVNAQVDAVPFYARYGFAPVGLEFEEAGIVHRVMELVLSVGQASA